jgi:hypothetical protein
MASTDLLALARQRVEARENSYGKPAENALGKFPKSHPRANGKMGIFDGNLGKSGILSENTWEFPGSFGESVTEIPKIPTDSHLWENCGNSYPMAVGEAVEAAAIAVQDLPVQRLRKRMVSWAQPDDEPAIGDFCGACAGQIWWTRVPKADGWCCCTCHPATHLAPGQYVVRAT